MSYSAKRALLSNIIDYAGTFPPAALALKEALKEAATYRKNLRQPWLVGKMALPLSDLKQLNARALIEAGSDGTPWLFTALGTAPEGHESAVDIARAVEWDLREVQRFNDRGMESSCRHQIVAYEMKLPPAAFVETQETDGWVEYFTPILERFESRAAGRVELYVEVPHQSADTVSRVADALCIWLEEESDNSFAPGLKVRTGGNEPPSPENLAHFVDTVISRGLRFKATQGLHEAVTHHGSYGFVNLFAALNFAQAIGRGGFPAKTIQACLTEESAKAFQWKKDSLSWSEFSIDAEKIENARRHHAGCFGSCSIVEPDESLLKIFPEDKA